ncbi:putative N-acetylmannosamine-6-phosphate 2-epimerase [Corynebacterium callunae]|uniref:putative N-acetylmannosamine-6-phosphate 2-epimerase n=1 Tax=Corynebacterium callunae TaxID=1721 RepID=UPI003982721B
MPLNQQRNHLYSILKGQIIPSVHMAADHPMRDTHTLTQVAAACAKNGALAIRCGGTDGLADIESISKNLNIPVFGLVKEGSEGVHLTPTRDSVRAIAEAGATVVCADATFRPRPDGSTFAELAKVAHDSRVLILADCATPEEVMAAHKAGADFISTTLAGYTHHRSKTPGPDFEFLEDARALVPSAFLIAGGRISTTADAKRAFDLGADAVIVGAAITDPGFVYTHFVAQVL